MLEEGPNGRQQSLKLPTDWQKLWTSISFFVEGVTCDVPASVAHVLEAEEKVSHELALGVVPSVRGRVF